MMRHLVFMGPILIGGCGLVNPISDACPTLYNYPQEVQDQAADELEALPEGSALSVMIGHYGVVRNEIRACRGQ